MLSLPAGTVTMQLIRLNRLAWDVKYNCICGLPAKKRLSQLLDITASTSDTAAAVVRHRLPGKGQSITSDWLPTQPPDYNPFSYHPFINATTLTIGVSRSVYCYLLVVSRRWQSTANLCSDTAGKLLACDAAYCPPIAAFCLLCCARVSHAVRFRELYEIQHFHMEVLANSKTRTSITKLRRSSTVRNFAMEIEAPRE